MRVDSHCHLDFPDLAEDRDGVLARAADAGVGTMVTISTKMSTFEAVRGVAEDHDHIWCSLGVHPHHVAEEERVPAERLIELASHPKVIGIGETGLDYYYDRSPRDVQAASFRTHIKAARETGLPVIVHTRDAEEDTAKILREEMEEGAFTGLLHCFSSGPGLARAAIDLGLYISFSGILTFNKSEELREIAGQVPEDRLLVETDAPYLAPAPKRGKRNEPAFVAHTARKLAQVRGWSEERTAETTTENFFRLFTKAARPS